MAMAVERLEDALQAYEDAFNSGELDDLLALYEPGATFVPQPGQIASGTEAIREALSPFFALKGRLEIDPTETRIVQAGEIALVSGSWTLTGTGPDGEAVSLSGRTADVLRCRPDGTWRWVVDLPFGIS